MKSSKSFSDVVRHYVIEWPSFRIYFLAFFGLVVFFGLIYSQVPTSHGWTPANESNFWNHLFEGMYLSIVTMTSLGYGDLQPNGISRLVAGVEVVLGLMLIGLMIAKLTSEGVSHFVSSIYVSDTQSNFADFSMKFNMSSSKIRRRFAMLYHHFQTVPSPPNGDQVHSNLESKTSGDVVEKA